MYRKFHRVSVTGITQSNPRTNAELGHLHPPCSKELRVPPLALSSNRRFLLKNDPRRTVLPVRAPTTCALTAPCLDSLGCSSGDAVRKPTTTLQRLLALIVRSDARTALSATRASLSASAVSRRATMLLGGGRSSASSAHASVQLASGVPVVCSRSR